MTKQDELIEALEALVDAHGLKHTVDALASVCYLKANHLWENWQDNSSAKVWERAGMVLDRDGVETSIHLL